MGVCADGAPGHPARTLYWRAGAAVTIDLRRPASDVQIGVARIGGFAKPIHNNFGLRARRDDPEGRRWTVTLARSATRSTDLLISARFAPGDLDADLGLRPK
ncbi:MAG: hypothetical protein QOE18_1560 [Chloroflexota bacterium]|nr:hypothetical protein [Chloroflexota bacterium]